MATPWQYVFPVRLDNKAPAIKDWQARSRPFEQWLGTPEWEQHRRWGAPAGSRNGWWVLDIDPRHGGENSLAALVLKYGPLEGVFAVRTPSGGLHYYFLWQPICAHLSNTVGKLGPGLDIRVEGGMVLCPPSPGYECITPDVPIPMAPAWLLALLLPAAGSPGADQRSEPAGDGEAPIRRPREHFARALQAALEEIRAAPDGQKDATMNRNAYGIGRIAEVCGFSLEQVAQPLIDLCIELGYTPEKVLSCIPRALADGAKNPRVVAAVTAPAVSSSSAAGDANVLPAAEAPTALRPCPPKPGTQPADLTSEAGRRWLEKSNEYQAWHRDLRAVLDARLVVVEYDQTRVLHERVGLRRVAILGTADKQAGHIIAIGRRHGFLVPAGTASSLAEEYLRLDADRVLREHPSMWDRGDGLYRWDRPAVKAGEMPTWDTILSRLSDADAFLAHVWSIFEPKYKGRQVLWLQGAGDDGKSIAVTSIVRGANLPVASLSDGDLIGGNQFLFSSVWDKPLVLVQESKNVNVLMTGTVHKLTGRDMVSVEYKHGQRFVAQFQGVVFVTSNGLPQIEKTAANKTRLSVVTISPPKGFIVGLEDKLKAELPALLFSARRAYEVRCPDHYRIGLNETAQAAVEAATGYEDETHATILHAAGIRIEGDEFMSRKDVMRQVVATGAKLDANRISSFYRWLAEQPGVLAGMREGVRGFRGIRL